MEDCVPYIEDDQEKFGLIKEWGRGPGEKAFYVWVLSGKICLQESWAPEKVWKKDELPLVEEDQIREHLNRLDVTEIHPDRIHL